MSEFHIIKKYFSKYFRNKFNKEILGVGDDCAIFSAQENQKIAISTDMLIEKRHFFSNTNPYNIGYKSLAVNLSDLAAVGAHPIGCLLSIGIPTFNKEWLFKFSKGFYDISEKYDCPLIGGDTTKSNKSIIINVTIFGNIPNTKSMKRDNAKIGDEIWVSGVFGEPDIAYRILSGQIHNIDNILENIKISLEMPIPRITLGKELIDHANAAIDISDGLIQDLNHILEASKVGANINYKAIPISNKVIKLPENIKKYAVLNGGDLYELCFTAPLHKHDTIVDIAKQLNIKLSVIGNITSNTTLKINGIEKNYDINGFDHFK
ncbi:Thiamine-monophosphate kinase [Candidatus Kinetoplastibacterium sorsogonicusi]|uniref:Thiamine-monophosphate kinase n=1 Tax=Candidatus Kinetoplastidibacterium kentomonadis TaxID=1576550 RepID=A0A3Q8ER90_9PROT|nr:thiamine-phosphate kinase [Candidatus Kinetoplastibacterium sorsogonicusi]AWD32384.1 Thiamine-monophosphate kinase [Candidatus Kinetoplastibacterium sorsogonicusi]